MDDNPSHERRHAIARRKSLLAEVIAEPLFIRAIRMNIAYVSRLFPRWNTQVCGSIAYNPNIHLEPWQKHDLLVRAGLTRALVSRFLNLGNREIRNHLRNPNRLVRAVLSRFIEEKTPEVTCVATLEGHSDYVEFVTFHLTASLLATGSTDKTAKLWRFSADGSESGMTCVAILAGHSLDVYSVAFHPTAPLLATVSYDKTAKLWRFSPDGTEATCVATLAGHSHGVTSVAFHPTAPLLATGSDDKTVKLWR